MRIANRRFEKLANRLGFDVLKSKSDMEIDEVVYKKIKQFSIPRRMNCYPNKLHSWRNMELPNLHDLDTKARWFKLRKNTTQYFRDTIKEVANQKFNPQEYEV